MQSVVTLLLFDFMLFGMMDVDSSNSLDADEEVSFYCSQSTSKQSSKDKSVYVLSCEELVKSLRKRGLSEAICKALKDNNVHGKTFVNLTRSDLSELLPDFNDRKELWDFHEQMRKTGYKLARREFNTEEGRNLPEISSPASTLSVESSTEESPQESPHGQTPSVPKLKRRRSLQQGPKAKKIELSTAQPSNVNLTSLKFPISKDVRECVKKGKPLPDDTRRELIRECVTCLKAQCGDVISHDAFTMASKMICAEVPVLKDVEPPHWPEEVKFEYWTSVLYLLKKRYMNIKSRGKSAERSKSAKDQSNLEPKVSEKDNESLYKELLKEVCGKKKKKEINWEVVKKLQRLTFSSRRDSILEISGSGIVSKIMEKFPFLDNETCLWNELEFCVSEETDQDVGVDVFAKQWEQIAKCFLKEDVGNDDICSAALETMPKEFNSASSSLQSFIPDHTSLETFLKNLETNDPQLISYNGNASEGVEDPSSIQIFVVVDKEVLLECKTPSGRDALISLLAVHYALNLKYHATHTFMYKFIEEHVLGMMPRRKSYAYKKIENALLSKLKDCSAD